MSAPLSRDDGHPTELDAAADLAGLATDLTGLVAAGIPVTTELTALAPTSDPVAFRQQLAAQKVEIMRRREEIEEAAERFRAEAERIRMQSLAALDTMSAELKKMNDGLEAVDMYLGAGERIDMIRDGVPADVTETISIRQLVLSMDQECAVSADGGGIDARDVDRFFDWLTADPAHLQQILPEPKGIVALVPRFTDRDYQDPWTQSAMDHANTTTWLLIRNGEKLFTTSCGFRVGRHLIPTRDQFTKIFADDGFGRPLNPGTAAWARAEQRADASQRHYMKVALWVQGIVERSVALQPLPAAVSMLHPESYDAGHVRVITDAELAIGVGRPSFYEWLRSLNSQLRPGMRVVGNFGSEGWRSSNEFTDRHRGHSRLSPMTASAPKSNTVLTIEGRNDQGLVLRYARSDKRWGHQFPDARYNRGEWGEWPYEKRASCVIRPSDQFIIPFDLVTVEEMRAYLDARTERHNYVSMFPVLQAAIAAKHAEAEAEAPFRQLVAGQLIAAGHDSDDTALAASVDTLVNWWKVANRWHRPLVDPDPQVQTKALASIVKEWCRRSSTGRAAGTVVDTVLAQLPDAMFIAARTDGKIVAVVPERPADHPAGNVFIAEHVFTKTGKPSEVRRWRMSGARLTRLAAEHVTDRWLNWNHQASPSEYLSDPEIAEAGAVLATEDDVLVVEYSHTKREFEVWKVDGEFSFDTEHPLSARHAVAEVDMFHVRWRRGVGGRVEVPPVRSRRSRYVMSEWPWLHERADRKYTGGDRVVTVQDRIDAFEAARAAHVAHEERASVLRYQVNAWVSGIARVWRNQALTDAYEAFMAEYNAADLWESHRKAKRLDNLRLNFDAQHALTDAATVCVEAGVVVTAGMSVRQVLTLAAADLDAPLVAGLLDLVSLVDADTDEDA